MKPQRKAPAKPVKTAAKAKAKPAAKAAKAKTPAKPAAKPAVKAAAKKAPAKAPAKKAASAKTTKPAVKAKAPAKAPAKKAAPAKAAPPKKAAAPAPAPAKKAPTPPAKAAPAPAAKAGARPTPVAPAPAPAMPPAPSAPGTPPRAAKPSARLAQITVPSMAQSVASTAAKASYIQTPAPSVLTPPPLVNVKKDPKLANNWKSKSADELSDAEVLAMPDSEYMNEKQMAFFRRKLVQLKQDILNNAGETTEHLREDTVIVPDPADRATIEEEHALELRTRDRERKLLKKIEQSIARIDAGDYGYCDETGEPIGVGRLLARPTATLSLEAQQRRELKQKMFGD
ncbi:RNA polymerase-binding protein DksA [Ramlibacter humi]|uniref:RNA polymerase-binding protein DksA n=1 Tax=Ramlibacter humi TaxID=2530451 RepID=UPI001EF13CD4|nr:RNA polymerase-binding protein DksA [Ramlibacter humi]